MSKVGAQNLVRLSSGRTNYHSVVIQYEDTVTQTNSARLEINNKGVSYFVGINTTG